MSEETQQENSVRTIKETNQRLRAWVETPEIMDDFFWTGGTITYYYKSNMGHQYFTLEDVGFSIDCMLPNTYAGNAPVELSKHLVIDVYGRVDFYVKKAQLQMQVQKIRLVDGSQAEIDPNVMQKLEEKRLWPRKKRDLPMPPRRIALITSKNSEALHDFENTYRAEGGLAHVELLDVRVQGEQAVGMITDAIQRVNHQQTADVIVLVRGGGRYSDLATFNDIQVAEAICRSDVPVVTGIGHHQNDTIADRVADEKTSTPTQAALELAKLSRNMPETASAGVPLWLIVSIGSAIIVLLLVLIVQQL